MTPNNDTGCVRLTPAPRHLQMEIPLAGGIILTPTGLRMPETITEEDYDRAGDVVFLMGDWAKLCQSDFVQIGRARFGDETAARKLRTRGIGEQEVRTLFRLEAVEVRKATLTVEHHYAVSKLDKLDQSRWLETAEQHSLSPADLRASIRANAVVRAELHFSGGAGDSDHRISATASPQSIAATFERWRAEADPSLAAWPLEVWRATRDALEPIARFHDLCRRRVSDAEAGAKLPRVMGGGK